MPLQDCLNLGGTPSDYYGVPCDPNPCAGACCPRDPSLGECQLIIDEESCTTLGAGGWVFLGIGSTCAECPTCLVYCGPTATVEGELCDDGVTPDTYNGGCNSTPRIFQLIECGQTIFGTTWRSTCTSRDTDWFEVVTTEPTAFRWYV